MAHFLCHLGCSHFGALLLDFYFTENSLCTFLHKAALLLCIFLLCAKSYYIILLNYWLSLSVIISIIVILITNIGAV